MGFFDSEMERSFLKTAKKKGWVKDEPIVKEASTTKIAATGNVDVDICVLIDALRTKGHEKQAEALEASYLEYKKAASELYDIDTDEGIEFLEMAHPDGDQKIGDSSKGYGDVETLLSAHKKIRDIATKDPSKKKSIAEAASLINKIAQSNTIISAQPFGAGNVAQFIGSLEPTLEWGSVIQALKQNSGNLYNFLNIYYNDFFKKAYEYYSMASIVYGDPSKPYPNLIVSRLNEGGIDYLNKLQSQIGINTSMLVRQLDDENWFERWYDVEKSSIAEKLHRQFNQKYGNFQQYIDKINTETNAKINQIAKQISTTEKKPYEFLVLYNSYVNDGTWKYLAMVLAAFYTAQHTQTLKGSVEAARSGAETILSEQPARQGVTTVEKPQGQTGVGRERALSTPLEKFREAQTLLGFSQSDTGKQNAGIISQVAALAGSGRPFEDVQKALEGINIRVSSPQDIADLADQYLAYAREKAGE